MSEIIKARVMNKYAPIAEWLAADPVLLKGEFAIVKDGAKIRIKVGDGGTNFSQLLAIDDASSAITISAAVPTTNPGPTVGNRIFETATAGTYTNFKNVANASIVVNSGELVHLIDTGSYFVKVVVPLTTSALVTLSQLGAATDGLYNLQYNSGPQSGGEIPIDKTALSFAAGVPATGDFYVDMNLSFDISRLKAIKIKGIVSGDYNFSLVTIDESNNVTVIDSDGDSVVGGTIGTYNFNGYPDGPRRGYVALQNSVGNPLRLNTAATGKTVYQFNPSLGFVTALANTDINYFIELYPVLALQAGINTDKSVTAIRSYTGNTGICTTLDTTILYNLTGASGTLQLPVFGISAGKTFVVKFATGAGVVNVFGSNSAAIDGVVGPAALTAAGQFVRLQFDGNNFWRV